MACQNNCRRVGATLTLLFSLAGFAGAAPDRKEACSDYALPDTYTPFLDTAFLGPELFLATGAVNFSYFRFGPLSQTAKAGRPLVLIVGLSCTKSTWTPDLLSSLAASREVIIYDNRGTGHSDDKDFPESITIDGFASSTMDLIDALGLQQPDILGWSMGGVISLQIATHYGNMVNSIIIVNSAVPKPETLKAGPEYLDADRPLDLWKGQIDPVVLFPDTAVGNRALCRYIKLFEAMPKNSISPEAVRAERRALIKAFKSTEIYDRLGRITNPTLMFVGTAQGEGPASYEMESKIPSSVVIGFSNAAHGAIFQHSILGAQLITDFLDSNHSSDMLEAASLGAHDISSS